MIEKAFAVDVEERTFIVVGVVVVAEMVRG